MNMMVYIVVRGMDWEGAENLGVYLTEAGAEVAVEAMVARENADNDMVYRRKGDREWRDGASYIVIEEHVVGE